MLFVLNNCFHNNWKKCAKKVVIQMRKGNFVALLNKPT